MMRNSQAIRALLRRCGRLSLTEANQSANLQAVPPPVIRKSEGSPAQCSTWLAAGQSAVTPTAWETRSYSAAAADTGVAGIDESLSAAANSGDPEAVFKVIEEHGQHFSEGNVTNSFTALAKVADSKGLDEGTVHGHRSFQTLVDMILLGIRRYDSKQLLSVLGSSAKLGFDDDMLIDTISSRLLKNVETLDAAQLVDLVTSLGEAESSPSIALFDALQAHAETLGNDMSPDMKAQLQDAYAKLGYHRLSDAAKEI